MFQLYANEFVDLLGGPNIVQHVGGIALAALLGAALGAEREWRAKDAGLRTTTLVAMGAALFTIAGAEAVDSVGSGDPMRVASQIVSGIGFLGAGVIIKHGSSVKGLTTAATMWAAAAIGVMSGAGLHLLALVGALLIMFSNIALRPLVKWIAEHSPNVSKEGEVDYTIEVLCDRTAERDIRGLLFAAATGPGLMIQDFSSTGKNGDTAGQEANRVELQAVVLSHQRQDSAMESALAEIVDHPDVHDVKWSVIDH